VSNTTCFIKTHAKEAAIMTKKTRLNPMQKAKANPKSLRAAVNARCFECGGCQYKEVILCPVKECPLWPHRPWQINKTTKKGEN